MASEDSFPKIFIYCGFLFAGLDQVPWVLAGCLRECVAGQGAEGRVLAGAKETLKRTKSVFIEVALTRSPYEGALLFPEIEALLKSEGFMCVALGVGSWNGGGNAFFVKDFGKLVCK